jgi:dTDP-4-dehydrorhamnose reductase
LKAKILILGSSGLIGHQMLGYFEQLSQFEVHDIALTRKARSETKLVDLRNEEVISQFVLNLKPNYIINCAGLLIHASEKDVKSSIALNAYLPHLLVKLLDIYGGQLIHISTDCVFSGSVGQYIENAVKDGTSIYSKTKSLGEIFDENHLTVRTSVVGPELKINSEELFNWFMFQENDVNGYEKSIWSGVSTLFLPRAIENLIINKVKGLYQVTSLTPISKYELLCLFKKYSGKQYNVNRVEGYITDKSLVDTRGLLKLMVPTYDEMISEIFDFVRADQNKRYEHYNLIK